MKTNSWYVARDQNLAMCARNAGFDLALYHTYSESVQKELRKRAIKEALHEIREACSEQGCDLPEVKEGVYVISLSNPFSIKYRDARSQVIYIGLGNIVGRIESHFNHSLFDVMLDLLGANFDFHFALPKRKGRSHDYYKHVEHCMLEYFSKEYGGLDDKKRFPLLNKNAGSKKKYSEDSEWWKKPLKASGRKPHWELKPTENSYFAPLDTGSD